MVAPADGIADSIDAAEEEEAGERQIHAEEYGENVGKAAAEPDGVQTSRESQYGPDTEHGERAELGSGGQARIVTERNHRPNSTAARYRWMGRQENWRLIEGGSTHSARSVSDPPGLPAVPADSRPPVQRQTAER